MSGSTTLGTTAARPNTTTRRHPRTLAEAFPASADSAGCVEGPYRSSDNHPLWWVAAIALVALVGYFVNISL